VMFFFLFCLFVTLWNYKVCDNGNRCEALIMSLHAGRFAVVHLYLSFSVDGHNFPLGANLYQNYNFSRFSGL